MNTLVELLLEANSFHERLTSDINVVTIENELRKQLHSLKLNDSDPFSTVSEGPGIYYLEARFPFTTLQELDNFGNLWGIAKAKDLEKSIPRYYPQRAKKQKALLQDGNFIPFYLGKEFSVKNRLKGHMNGASNSTTYALKLKHRKAILEHVEFQFSHVAIDVTKNAYFCVELLEKALRKRLHPIIGRQ